MTVELIKSPFWYLYKLVNYVQGRLVYRIRAGGGCMRVGGVVRNTLKGGGKEKRGRKTKILKRTESWVNGLVP